VFRADLKRAAFLFYKKLFWIKNIDIEKINTFAIFKIENWGGRVKIISIIITVFYFIFSFFLFINFVFVLYYSLLVEVEWSTGFKIFLLIAFLLLAVIFFLMAVESLKKKF
jgi:hypothetical protein